MHRTAKQKGGVTITTEQIQCLLRYLGFDTGAIDGIWGQRSGAALKKFQEAYGNLTVDGIPGPETCEALLQAVYSGFSGSKPDSEDFWKEIVYFTPEEFMCQCRKQQKYCDGWPHPVQPLLVQIADRTRKHFGRPITIVSGLRCEKHNAAVGGVRNSQHMYGEAADIYVSGVSPEAVLHWFQNQRDVRYAYRIDGSNNIHFDIPKQGRED